MLNFRLITEFQTIHRRSLELADSAILSPNDVRPLVEGEWLEFDANYNMARGGDNTAVVGTPDDESTVPTFPYFAEQGRYETQALGKGPFLMGGFYEAETKIFDAAGLALNDALSVYDVSVGGIIRRGLAKTTAGLVVGYVSRLPSANNGWLRFHTWR